MRFSPRLRWVTILAIERIRRSELKVSELETIRLLDRLYVDMDDAAGEGEWRSPLTDVRKSPMGPKSLSPHCWHLLEKLVPWLVFESPDAKVVRSLEEAEDWERLEALMVIA